MSYLRTWFTQVSHKVKLCYYCDLLNINSSNLTKFIKGYDKAVKLDKLLMLQKLIINDLSKLDNDIA